MSDKIVPLRLSDKLPQVDGFYSLLLTAKRLDTEVRPDNGADLKAAKRLTMAKTMTAVAKSLGVTHSEPSIHGSL